MPTETEITISIPKSVIKEIISYFEQELADDSCNQQVGSLHKMLIASLPDGKIPNSDN